ncbi:hypothetical protein AK812_SmicGene36722 [Symbiodinium microadriaticum]|uniref:Uncharacterized protein n=1 Tax=Symbiodinium microadriaticum TaxID=2951 RepID=A0A1Q9CIA0_SYMMI|nr:hypothetical protein AK812_SmicGene36722 [Symbiodinium microadriaticum]
MKLGSNGFITLPDPEVALHAVVETWIAVGVFHGQLPSSAEAALVTAFPASSVPWVCVPGAAKVTESKRTQPQSGARAFGTDKDEDSAAGSIPEEERRKEA